MRPRRWAKPRPNCSISFLSGTPVYGRIRRRAVLGGLINLVLVGVLLIALVRVAARWAEFRAVRVPAAFLAMMLTSGSL